MNLKSLSPATFASALAVLSTTAVVSTAAPAHAFFVPGSVTMSYGCVSGSICPTGQNHFQTKVSSTVNPNQILFQFFNVSPTASSITGIFFKDTKPKSLASFVPNSIVSSSGVNFSQNSSPGSFPGSSNAANFSFSANNSAQGINQGQTLSLLFNLQPGFSTPTFTAVLADLKSKSLQIGLTGSFGQGRNSSTASFVNQAVPEPLTMLGSGAALGMGALLKRKTAASKKEKEKVQAS